MAGASPSPANPPTVDSHHHFWDVERFDYEWMPPEPSVLRHSYLPRNLRPVLERNGVERTVLVQAHASVEEAEFLLALATGAGFVAGVVAWVDLTSPDVGASLDRLSRMGPLIGIRHVVETDPDEAWLSRDASIRGLREVARRGLAYDLLVKPPHLKHVPQLAERVPELRMVVDHIAKPPIASGEMEPWASDIAAVAAIPGVYCKVSGMVTEADHSGWTVDDLRPYVAHVVERFGFGRLMWGSDWPVCLLASNYDDVRLAAIDALGPMTAEDRDGVLGRNATDFYRL